MGVFVDFLKIFYEVLWETRPNRRERRVIDRLDALDDAYIRGGDDGIDRLLHGGRTYGEVVDSYYGTHSNVKRGKNTYTTRCYCQNCGHNFKIRVARGTVVTTRMVWGKYKTIAEMNMVACPNCGLKWVGKW